MDGHKDLAAEIASLADDELDLLITFMERLRAQRMPKDEDKQERRA